MEEELKHIKAIKSFDRLLTIMDTLRKQCPWDKNRPLILCALLQLKRRMNLPMP